MAQKKLSKITNRTLTIKMLLYGRKISFKHPIILVQQVVFGAPPVRLIPDVGNRQAKRRLQQQQQPQPRDKGFRFLGRKSFRDSDLTSMTTFA